MVPPYTMSEGLLRRAIAITVPGMFLSHPGSEMLASYHCGAHVLNISHTTERAVVNPLKPKDSYSNDQQEPHKQEQSTPKRECSIQPGSTCAPMTVSTLSAMRSRDCRLKLMPSVPMLIASLTPTVLNLGAAWTAALLMLHRSQETHDKPHASHLQHLVFFLAGHLACDLYGMAKGTKVRIMSPKVHTDLKLIQRHSTSMISTLQSHCT